MKTKAKKPSVYIALSLTHLKTKKDKNWVRRLMKWFEESFDVELFAWAFDLELWKPKPVADIYEFDTARVRKADLMIVMYLSNDGSDGRGGEVVNRSLFGGPMLAFALADVKVSRYPVDCLRSVGVDIVRIQVLEDMRPYVTAALERIAVKNHFLRKSA